MPLRSNHGEVLLAFKGFLPLGSEATNTKSATITYTNRYLSKEAMFCALFVHAFLNETILSQQIRFVNNFE